MLNHQKISPCRTTARDSEQGFILLMLMLFVALLAIAAMAVAPTLAFQVRRDREEELIHRGVQYSRAIRRYVKKTGRYPSRLEELENTNNLRFLRKRYKDPITGQDFKLLHVGEVQLTGGVGIAGATSIPGAASALGAGATAGAAAAVSMLSGATQPGSMVGGTANPMLGANPNQPASAGTAATTAPPGATENSGQDGQENSPSPTNQAKTEPSQSSSQDSKLSSQIFGGGPIVGVTSASKAQSIREFNHKNHYNQWQFIYDPTMDRGGLIKTPAQPALQVTAPIQPQNSSNPLGGPQGSNPPSVQPVQPVQPQQQ